MIDQKFPFANNDTTRSNGKSLILILVLLGTAAVYVSNARSQALVERISVLENEENLTARGIIVPNAEVTFSTSLVAPINDLPLKAGASFQKGDRLIGFDCGRARAELRGANAANGKQKQIFENRQKLMQRNAASAFEVEEAKADFQVTQAQVEAIEEAVKYCEIKAPFSGRVLELHSDKYELPGLSVPLLTVIDDSALEIDLIIPSKWLQWISVGGKFEFFVEETGESYQAETVRLGAKVDAVSQTIKITGKFLDRPPNVLSGMSGSARFNPAAL